jgi:hypothetical protein
MEQVSEDQRQLVRDVRRHSGMRKWALAAVVLLSLSACDDRGAGAAPPSPSSSSVTRAPVGRLPQVDVAIQRVPADLQGIALFGHHVAYVEDGLRLVSMDWRTGRSRIVARSTFGSLFMLPTSGRFVSVLDQLSGAAGDDPASPRRTLSLDLVTGHSTSVASAPGEAVVGGLNDVSLQVLRPRREGADPWRADLVEVWQQPDPDLPDRPLTTNGLVVEAAFDGDHRVVWTQRPDHSSADPSSLWTLDLFHPGVGARRLAVPSGVPYSPVVGVGFVGWAADGRRLMLMPVGGGAVTRVAGHLGHAVAPSADRHLLAFVRTHHGRSELVVLRVG